MHVSSSMPIYCWAVAGITCLVAFKLAVDKVLSVRTAFTKIRYRPWTVVSIFVTKAKANFA